MIRYIFTVCFSLFAIYSISQEKVIDQVIAVVGKNIVLQSELESQYLQYLNSDQPVESNTKCKLFEQILYQKLLLAQAQKDSIEITDAQVEAELDKRLRYYIVQFGSEEKFEQFYGKTVNEFKTDLRDNIRDLLLSQKMQSKITDGISVSPAEVKSYFESIPPDSVPFINAEVEIGEIVKKPFVSDEEKKEARARIESLRERVMKGEDMGTLAILYSEDPSSSKDGGQYKNIPRGQFVPEFDAVAFRIKEKEISEVFETPYGFHFMQLLEKRGEVVDIRHILITPKTTYLDIQKARTYLDSILRLLSKDSVKFSDAAGKYSDDEETKNNGGLLINPQTGISKFEMDEISLIDPTLVFGIDNMKVGEYIPPALFTTRDGKQAYRLIYLKSRTEPHKSNLKNDYQRIQAAAISEKQNKIVSKWVKKKTSSIYVKISDDYKNCKFEHSWVN